MAQPPPQLILINHDDYQAKHIGVTPDGRQFFLTEPFVPALAEMGAEFLALYLFDGNGQLLNAQIEAFGPRHQVDDARFVALRQRWLDELGAISFCNIQIAPFRLERFGVEFGLILEAPENEDEHWLVTAEPGNTMAFYPPWDGDYDT